MCVCVGGEGVYSNPGSPFRILSRITCQILPGSPSDFSPKLRDKIRNGEPGFEAWGGGGVSSFNILVQLCTKNVQNQVMNMVMFGGFVMVYSSASGYSASVNSQRTIYYGF